MEEKYRYMAVFMYEKFDINLFKTPIQYFAFIIERKTSLGNLSSKITFSMFRVRL